MPIYEFHCAGCGHRFEKLSRGNTREHPCPECGATANRAVSAPAAVPTGSGGGFCGGGSGFT